MHPLYDSTQPWRDTRFTHIDAHYPTGYFTGKTVLEVAAAWGHIGAKFHHDYGAVVTCTDYYSKWIDVINERYPYLTTHLQDINVPWNLDEQFFDVIIHMGAIYHQPPAVVEDRLTDMLNRCTDMIIETTVNLSSDDPFGIERVDPPTTDTWEPIEMITDYCRPSFAFMDRVISNSNKEYKFVLYTEPAIINGGNEGRGLWFCKAR